MAVQSELVNTILARTREGKLIWEELSSTGFLTRVGQTIIVIDRPRNEFALRITTEAGKFVEASEPTELQHSLEEIYELARRQALGVEDILANLKRSLDRL